MPFFRTGARRRDGDYSMADIGVSAFSLCFREARRSWRISAYWRVGMANRTARPCSAWRRSPPTTTSAWCGTAPRQSPAPRLIGTPRKRRICAREVDHGPGQEHWSAAGRHGASTRVWRSSARGSGPDAFAQANLWSPRSNDAELLPPGRCPDLPHPVRQVPRRPILAQRRFVHDHVT